MSRFPGMDPYLEHPTVWHDFHESFLVFLRTRLRKLVSTRYIVRLEEQLSLQEENGNGARTIGIADVSLAETDRPAEIKSVSASVRAPVVLQRQIPETEKESVLEILEKANRRVITVIELLSPSNKSPGRDRQRYLLKRGEYLISGVHLVELDLLRGGPRMPFQDLPKCDYYAMVNRMETREKDELWPLNLRDPLPSIPIPLRAPDAEVTINLQDVFSETFESGGYSQFIYEHQPVPPLNDADAAWASRILTASQSS